MFYTYLYIHTIHNMYTFIFTFFIRYCLIFPHCVSLSWRCGTVIYHSRVSTTSVSVTSRVVYSRYIWIGLHNNINILTESHKQYWPRDIVNVIVSIRTHWRAGIITIGGCKRYEPIIYQNPYPRGCHPGKPPKS